MLTDVFCNFGPSLVLAFTWIFFLISQHWAKNLIRLWYNGSQSRVPPLSKQAEVFSSWFKLSELSSLHAGAEWKQSSNKPDLNVKLKRPVLGLIRASRRVVRYKTVEWNRSHD